MSKKLTTGDFIVKSRKIHGNKYDYSKVNYVDIKTKVIITCLIHGDFQQTPGSHINQKSGCKKCGRKSQTQKRKLGLEKFITESKKVHGDRYDYSKVDYINNRTNITIICKEHGEFYPSPSNHISRKSGCPKCSIIEQHDKQKKTLNEFIKDSIKIHNNKYDYSESKYVSGKVKITVICKEHGKFYPTPNNHLRGTGCPKCSLIEQGERQTKTLDEFIIDSRKVHGDLYDYSQVDYINTETIISIRCKKHDELFYPTPNNHLRGSGCPICNYSKGELEISNHLKKLKIEFIPQYTFDDLVLKGKLRCDFYLNKRNVVIEYNGEQHYKPNNFFGGEVGFKKTQKRDKMKEDYCKENNIGFEVIRFDEDVVERLNEILGL